MSLIISPDVSLTPLVKSDPLLYAQCTTRCDVMLFVWVFDLAHLLLCCIRSMWAESMSASADFVVLVPSMTHSINIC